MLVRPSPNLNRKDLGGGITFFFFSSSFLFYFFPLNKEFQVISSWG